MTTECEAKIRQGLAYPVQYYKEDVVVLLDVIDTLRAENQKMRRALLTAKMEKNKGVESKAWNVTVCSSCLMASCWQGIFYCDNYKNAGTKLMGVETLRNLALESPDYWEGENPPWSAGCKSLVS